MATKSVSRTSRSNPDLPAILDRQHELKARIESASDLLLFLDFDGTLSPIAPRPALAELPNSTRQVLSELAGCAGIAIAIVSGRSLDDVRRRVGSPGLIYAGNHGLEIEGTGLAFNHPRAVELQPAVSELVATLLARSRAFKGVEFEEKGLTTSVHYRRASHREQVVLERLLSALVAPDDPKIEVTTGKMVYEIRPRVDWDKGRAVAWIRDQLGQAGALPIVIGDDETDENAFTSFDDAITICVDPRRPTAAQYCAESPEEVRTFLEWLAEVWKNGRR
jgi:trehalose-phosphatase